MPKLDPSQNPAPSDQASDAEPYTRLHISPLDSDLLPIVLSSSVLPKARAISYHTIETFPEKRYGFVELPTADADKIRKKLNGAVLKGAKMRIDKAKPETWADRAADDEGGSQKKKRKKEKNGGVDGDDRPESRPKKRKHDHNVVEGVELDAGRKVKRGWTVTDEDKIREKRKSKKDKDKKNQDKLDKKEEKKKRREERSKYTDREECLLKTRLPGPAGETGESDRKKSKKGKGRETVLHEFSNTTKFPTFLKANKPAAAGDSAAVEFVDGKGWVDTEGNVVEAVKSKPRKVAKSENSEAPKKAIPPPTPDDDTSSSGGSVSDGSDDDEATERHGSAATQPTTTVNGGATRRSGSTSEESSDTEGEDEKSPDNVENMTPAKAQPQPTKPAQEDDTTSSSGTSSSEDSDSSDSEDEANEGPQATLAGPSAALPSPIAAMKAESSSRPRSAGSNISLTITIPPATPARVHPLEALYKRDKEATTPGATTEAKPFSFFDSEDIEDGATPAAGQGGSSQIPLTPFTQQEFEWRNLRSAAPTPDTAHPSRMKNFWPSADEVDAEMGKLEEREAEDEDEDGDATMNYLGEAGGDEAGQASGSGAPAGEFQKWFWENRGDLNRSWMKRRKTAAKEKRHRENKSRAAKAM